MDKLEFDVNSGRSSLKNSLISAMGIIFFSGVLFSLLLWILPDDYIGLSEPLTVYDTMYLVMAPIVVMGYVAITLMARSLAGYFIILSTKLFGLSNITKWYKASRFSVLIISVLFAMWLLRTLVINPLPSDEVFVGRLHTHRAELERLLELYKNEDFVVASNSPFWPEISALMKQAGISRVARLNVFAPPSYAGINKYKMLYISFKETPPGRAFSFRYGFGLHGGVLTKSLLHVPDVPWHESGLPRPIRSLRILDSLNPYPSDWKEGECVLRKIEQHWFIKMCRYPYVRGDNS